MSAAPSSSSVPAVFYDADADRISVEPTSPRDPWDAGRVRLTHVLRDDNGNVGAHVLDLGPDAAREFADAILCAARAVEPAGTPRHIRGPVQDAFPVWRDGDRIRNAAGEGYADVVDDEQVARHASVAMEARHFQDAAFCVAVLSLRQQERAS